MHQAELELRAGEWQLASRKAAEGYERAEQIGREQDMSGLLYVTARLDAHLGRVQEARDAARRGIALSESCGDEVFLLLHLSVLGFLELSVGDPEARQDPEAACSAYCLVGIARAEHPRRAAERDRGARRAGRARGGAQASG